jgi:hypothetical protein
MGLDISAMSNIKRSEVQDPEDYDSIRIWHNSNFPDHCELEEGNWEETPQTRKHMFKAGSYSGYNQFRNVLALCTLGVKAETVWEAEDIYMNRPFFNLLNFSDCEGIIGPEYSEALYGDFRDNRDRFIRNLKQEIDFTKVTEDPLSIEPEFILEDFDLSEEEIEDYIESYDDWMEAFQLAKDGGIVQFH